MSARIAPAKIAKIRELRGLGRRFEEIAEAVEVSLNTARKYGRLADDEVVVATTPAAGLSAGEVANLRWLARQVTAFHCPACEAPQWAWREDSGGVCGACGVGWRVSRGGKSEEGA